MSQLPALLRTDLSQMAERVRRAGRGPDTMLAHITPQEAALLRARGGSGTTNPATGLPEFISYEDLAYEPEDLNVSPRFPVAPVVTEDLSQQYARAQDLRAGERAFAPEFQQTVFTDGSQGAGMPTEIAPRATENLQQGSVFQYPETAIQRLERIQATESGDFDFDLQKALAPYQDRELQQAFRDRLETAPVPRTQTAIERALREAARTGGEFLKTPLGYGAIGGIPALLQARRAARQAQGMREELGRLGQEARTQGQQLVAQARAGQVTAAQQQALDVQRAAAMQNLSRRGITGGTAVQQFERSLQDQRGRFLEDTLNQGMRLLNIGDQYTERAIRAQYAADAQAQQLLGNFFQNYMRVLAGQGATTTTPTPTTPRR